MRLSGEWFNHLAIMILFEKLKKKYITTFNSFAPAISRDTFLTCAVQINKLTYLKDQEISANFIKRNLFIIYEFSWSTSYFKPIDLNMS